MGGQIEHKLLLNRSINKNNCWIWMGGKTGQGYGATEIDGVYYSVHRLAAKIWLKDYSDTSHVLHKCDIPACFNPEHLEMGSQSKNMFDAYKRGKKCAVGKKNGQAILTEDDVREIRRLYVKGNQPRLAERFGVTRANISAIVRRESWGHIT